MQQVNNNYFHGDAHFLQDLYQPCYLRAKLYGVGYPKESMALVELNVLFCADFHGGLTTVVCGVQSDMPCQAAPQSIIFGFDSVSRLSDVRVTAMGHC